MSLINDALKRARASMQRKSPDASTSPAPLGAPMQPVYPGAAEERTVNWANVKLAVLMLLILPLGAAAYWHWTHPNSLAIPAVANAKPAKKKSAVVTQVAAKTIDSAAKTQVKSPATNNPIARAARTLDKVQGLHNEGEANASFVDAKPSKSADVQKAEAAQDSKASNPAGVDSKAVANAAILSSAAPVAATPSKEVVASSVPNGAQPAVSSAAKAHKLQAIFFRDANSSALINGKSVGIGQEVDGAKVRSIARQSVTLDVNGEARELVLR